MTGSSTVAVRDAVAVGRANICQIVKVALCAGKSGRVNIRLIVEVSPGARSVA